MRCLKGHVVFIDKSDSISDINTNVLPRLASEIDVLLILQERQNAGLNDNSRFRQLRIRRNVIVTALRWLIDHNPAYERYTISNTNVGHIPEDGFLDAASVRADEFNDEDLGPAQHQREVPQGEVVEVGTVDQDPATAQLRQRLQQSLFQVRNPTTGGNHPNQATFQQPFEIRNYVYWDEGDCMFWTKCFPTIFIPCTYITDEGVTRKDIPHSYRRKKARSRTFSFSDWANWIISSYPRFAAHPTLKFVSVRDPSLHKSMDEAIYA